MFVRLVVDNETSHAHRRGVQAKKLWTVGDIFGDWRKINAEYFDTGGFADQILASISTKRIAVAKGG